KKVAKEKAARYRFLLALLGFVGGQQRGLPALLCPVGIRAVPDKTCGARRGKWEQKHVTA
ncbi:MAG: hypothetical protein WAW36_19425, partial [Methylovulum miyakonense]|uniref:hypothetical protein n=1 Tax=Methylovulum miyakonense TaxID=645578 RepID=UPI003BB7F711